MTCEPGTSFPPTRLYDQCMLIASLCTSVVRKQSITQKLRCPHCPVYEQYSTTVWVCTEWLVYFRFSLFCKNHGFRFPRFPVRFWLEDLYAYECRWRTFTFVTCYVLTVKQCDKFVIRNFLEFRKFRKCSWLVWDIFNPLDGLIYLFLVSDNRPTDRSLLCTTALFFHSHYILLTVLVTRCYLLFKVLYFLRTQHSMMFHPPR